MVESIIMLAMYNMDMPQEIKGILFRFITRENSLFHVKKYIWHKIILGKQKVITTPADKIKNDIINAIKVPLLSMIEDKRSILPIS